MGAGASTVDQDTLARVAKTFAAIDTDKDGIISSLEIGVFIDGSNSADTPFIRFKEWMLNLTPDDKIDLVAYQAWFGKMVEDKGSEAASQQLEWAERVAAQPPTLSSEFIARIGALFKKIDVNSSGELVLGEVKEFMESFGLSEKAATTQAHSWFTYMNINKDAQIDYVEFERYFATHWKEMGADATEGLLAWLEGIYLKNDAAQAAQPAEEPAAAAVPAVPAESAEPVVAEAPAAAEVVAVEEAPAPAAE